MTTDLRDLAAGDVGHPHPTRARSAALRALGLGVAGAAALGAVPAPAGAATYYSGGCAVATYDLLGNLAHRYFQARINGNVDSNTGRWVWVSYDYKYTVDPGLSFGPHSDERVTLTQGYITGLSNPWHSPDNHGTAGEWIGEPGWKGVQSARYNTVVQFYAAFDIPNTPDPHCTVATARV